MFLLKQMSTENQDLQREGFNKINGKLFYRDKHGNWYQKGDGYNGYESMFLKDLMDGDLKNEIMNEMQGTNSEKISLQFENRWYTIFQNMEDAFQSNVNRKVLRKQDGENAYDTTQESKSGGDKPQNKFSNSGGNNKFSGGGSGKDGKKAFFYKNKDFVPLSKYKELNKDNYNIVILPPAQMDPNNYLIKENENEPPVPYVWIAEKVEMN